MKLDGDHLSLVLNTKLFIFILSLLIYLLYPTVLSYSDTDNDISLYLKVEISSADQAENMILFDVIRSSIELGVERTGISIINADYDSAQDNSPDTETYAADLAERFGTTGVLFCKAKGEGEHLKFELVLYVPDFPELTIRTVTEEKIDLTIDEAISSAVSKIMNQLKEYIPVLKKKAQNDVSKVEEAPEKAAARSPSETNSDFTDHYELSNQTSSLSFSVGVAPFLAVGMVNYYFSLGIMAFVYGGYGFETDIGNIEVGLSVDFLYFEALGILSSSSNFLIPLGVTGRWGTGFNDNLRLFFSVSGGPSLFIMKITETEQFFKITGFVSGGGGAGLLFSDNLGLTIEVDYTLFFEEYYPIMGIVPAVYFDIRI